MKKHFPDFFTYSMNERMGAVVLIFLVLVVAGFNTWFTRHPPKGEELPQQGWMEDSIVFLPPGEQAQPVFDTFRLNLPEKDDHSILFTFDPNTVKREDLLRLGLKYRVVNNLIKYRLKGGRFQTPEDLIKIYGMDSGIFKKLLPWIHITPETKSNGTPHREIVFVEINGADSATFEELPGIGPVLAARIIRYRNLLGGFYCIDQIREVYGLHDSLFNRLAGRLKADTSRIRKISINRAPVEELRRHPYIGRFAADGIIRYRHQVQVIHQVNELKMNGIIPIDRYEKLKNYLAD